MKSYNVVVLVCLQILIMFGGVWYVKLFPSITSGHWLHEGQKLNFDNQVSRERPYERCDECGSVYKMEYVGPPDDPHHPHHGYHEPKTMADYVKEEYWYK